MRLLGDHYYCLDYMAHTLNYTYGFLLPTHVQKGKETKVGRVRCTFYLFVVT